MERDDHSILHLYQKLIRLREHLLVLLNLGADPAETSSGSGTILASTCLDREGESVEGSIELRAAEGLILRLSS
jgi:hypothetical protein